MCTCGAAVVSWLHFYEHTFANGPKHFRLKQLLYRGELCTVALQDANGSCSALALFNCLSLTQRVRPFAVPLQTSQSHAPPEAPAAAKTCLSSTTSAAAANAGAVGPRKISATQLVLAIIKCLPQHVPDCFGGAKAVSEASQSPRVALSLRQDDDLDEPPDGSNKRCLPLELAESCKQLLSGLCVTPRFDGPTSFESSPATALFAALDVPLVHGWLAAVGELPSPSTSHSRLMRRVAALAELQALAVELVTSCPPDYSKMAAAVQYSLGASEENLPPDLCAQAATMLTDWMVAVAANSGGDSVSSVIERATAVDHRRTAVDTFAQAALQFVASQTSSQRGRCNQIETGPRIAAISWAASGIGEDDDFSFDDEPTTPYSESVPSEARLRSLVSRFETCASVAMLEREFVDRWPTQMTQSGLRGLKCWLRDDDGNRRSPAVLFRNDHFVVVTTAVEEGGGGGGGGVLLGLITDEGLAADADWEQFLSPVDSKPLLRDGQPRRQRSSVGGKMIDPIKQHSKIAGRVTRPARSETRQTTTTSRGGCGSRCRVM